MWTLLLKIQVKSMKKHKVPIKMTFLHISSSLIRYEIASKLKQQEKTQENQTICQILRFTIRVALPNQCTMKQNNSFHPPLINSLISTIFSVNGIRRSILTCKCSISIHRSLIILKKINLNLFLLIWIGMQSIVNHIMVVQVFEEARNNFRLRTFQAIAEFKILVDKCRLRELGL